MSGYFKNISEGISTTVTGMRLTLRHLWNARNRRKMVDVRSDDFFGCQEGMVTIQYPQETIPIPDNGRYRLHNEIDDCIVCDKCVKVCPVDCIDIEPIRAIEEVGRASDGSPIRLYAAKFDIDMAKCCYCGLCTTVCPTECLTMTKTFDYSELDVRDMVYNYANLTPEEADEKRRLLDQFQKEKEALKAAPKPAVEAEKPATSPARPVFLPKKPAPAVAKDEMPEPEKAVSEEPAKPATPKPIFKPKLKPPVSSEEKNLEQPTASVPEPEPQPEAIPETQAKPKPAFRPTMKPKMAVEPEKVEEKQGEESKVEEPKSAVILETEAKPKPAFRPTMKPKTAAEPKKIEEQKVEESKNEEPKAEEPKAEIIPEAEPKPKPAFRPTMKPRPKE